MKLKNLKPKNMKLKKMSVIGLALILIVSLAGCASTTASADTDNTAKVTESLTDTVTIKDTSNDSNDAASASNVDGDTNENVDEVTSATQSDAPAGGGDAEFQGKGQVPNGQQPNGNLGGMPGESTPTTNEYSSDASLDTGIDVTDQFSNRDLEQTVDLTGATTINLTSGKDVTITAEGVYLVKGSATNSSIIVAAPEDAKVQIVLDGVTITNETTPAIYVKTADKVFVTTTSATSVLTVNGTFTADGETNVDAVIFSKSDLTLNGTGTLKVVSKQGNAITSKDDLKVTGGTYNITALGHGLEANDSIRIYDGNFTMNVQKDAVHSENDEDSTKGYIYIKDGNFEITAADDAIHSNTIVQIDGGTINIKTASEGIEATFVQINGGSITIYATDDGINAANKSDNEVRIEVNGGTISVTMGSGDTDGFDSNGDLYINGGNITVTANSSFDVDGTRQLNSGTVIVNGQQVTEITVQQMGGGKRH